MNLFSHSYVSYTNIHRVKTHINGTSHHGVHLQGLVHELKQVVRQFVIALKLDDLRDASSEIYQGIIDMTSFYGDIAAIQPGK